MEHFGDVCFTVDEWGVSLKKEGAPSDERTEILEDNLSPHHPDTAKSNILKNLFLGKSRNVDEKLLLGEIEYDHFDFVEMLRAAWTK